MKLGRGGIREIELMVQALQIRTARTARAPRRAERWPDSRRSAARAPSAAEPAELARAYVFLRDVENKLQMVYDAQTHVLPDATSSALALLRARAATSAGRGRRGLLRTTAGAIRARALRPASPRACLLQEST